MEHFPRQVVRTPSFPRPLPFALCSFSHFHSRQRSGRPLEILSPSLFARQIDSRPSAMFISAKTNSTVPLIIGHDLLTSSEANPRPADSRYVLVNVLPVSMDDRCVTSV